MNRNLVIAISLAVFAGCGPTPESPPESTDGSQEPAPPVGVSTRLMLVMHRNGDIEVAAAIEEPGLIVLPNRVSGDFVYQVNRGTTLLSASAFSDPFVRRPMGEAGRDLPQMADTGNVVVKVPGVGLAEANYEVQVHRLVAEIPPDADLTPAGMQRITQSGAVQLFARLEPGRLATAVASKGRSTVRASLPPVGAAAANTP